MTSHEILNLSNNYQSELPLGDDVELSESEQDLMDAATGQERVIRDHLPQEVLDLMHETALREDGLRMVGYEPERISEILRRKWGPALARLGYQGIDVNNAFPSHDSEQTAPVRELRRPISQEKYDDLLDKAIDNLPNPDYTIAAQQLDREFYITK